MITADKYEDAGGFLPDTDAGNSGGGFVPEDDKDDADGTGGGFLPETISKDDSGGGFMLADEQPEVQPTDIGGGFIPEDEPEAQPSTNDAEEQNGGGLVIDGMDNVPDKVTGAKPADEQTSGEQVGQQDQDDDEDEDAEDRGSLLSHDPEDEDAEPEWLNSD